MFFPCQSLEAVLSQNNWESIRYTDFSHTYKDPFTIYFQLSTIYFFEFVEVKHNNLIISPQIQQEQTVETLLRYRPRHCNSILSLESTKKWVFQHSWLRGDCNNFRNNTQVQVKRNYFWLSPPQNSPKQHRSFISAGVSEQVPLVKLFNSPRQDYSEFSFAALNLKTRKSCFKVHFLTAFRKTEIGGLHKSEIQDLI